VKPFRVASHLTRNDCTLAVLVSPADGEAWIVREGTVYPDGTELFIEVDQVVPDFVGAGFDDARPQLCNAPTAEQMDSMRQSGIVPEEWVRYVKSMWERDSASECAQ